MYCKPLKALFRQHIQFTDHMRAWRIMQFKTIDMAQAGISINTKFQ